MLCDSRKMDEDPVRVLLLQTPIDCCIVRPRGPSYYNGLNSIPALISD